jgi:hypothetical protein
VAALSKALTVFYLSNTGTAVSNWWMYAFFLSFIFLFFFGGGGMVVRGELEFFFSFQALKFLQLKVLAFSTTSFLFPPSWTQAIKFWIFIWQMSCLMLSSHLYLGLPCDFDMYIS